MQLLCDTVVLNCSWDNSCLYVIVTFLAQVAKEKPPLTVVGDVGGRIAIMVVSHRFKYFFFIANSKGILVLVRNKKRMFSSQMFHVHFQDDIIDDAQSFVAVAQVLKNHGAYKIYIIATHGLLSADAPDLLESSPITEVNRTCSCHC